MDSMELQGDLQLNLLIFNDYILDTSYHTNRLELFMERELTSVLTLGLQVNVSTWTQHHKGHKISIYNTQTMLKLTKMDHPVSYCHLAEIHAI